MQLQPNIIFIVEIIGTIAFASSGAMVAVRKRLDLFGIIVLGVITAVGGGMLRDLMIGNIPPNMFRNPVYVLAAFLTVLVLFCCSAAGLSCLAAVILRATKKL